MTEAATAIAPDWVSPPGDTIVDLLEERGWTQAELAERSGFTRKHVNLLIAGKAPITEDTALKLERVLGSTARFWLTRETQYREPLARRTEQAKLEADIDWLRQLPMKDMLKFGWIQHSAHKGGQVSECLRYFGVASVAAWRSYYEAPLAAFRAAPKFEQKTGAVAAWLRFGELTATNISCTAFNKSGFRQALQTLRALTAELDPGVFVPKLIQTCAEVGVAVVIAPAPKGCPVSGATRWMTPEKALLMLSLRYKSNDQLWFSFFHEAGHLLRHGKRLLFLEIDGKLDNDLERDADRFAAETLIPPKHAPELASLPRTKLAVKAFAQHVGIAPGIVVGRMQRDGLLPWTHLNGLKVRYRWAMNEDRDA